MGRTSSGSSPTTVVLEVAQPFDVASLLDFFGRRTVTGIESIVEDRYSRTMRLSHGPASVRIVVEPERIEATFWLSDSADLASGVERCRQLFDLDADSVAIDGHLGRDRHLAAAVRATPGLRVPGHVDGFEVAVRAVVGQQISVAGARTILSRLVGDYGETYCGPDGLTHLFPSPDALAAVDPERLPMPRARGHALITIADAVASGSVVLDRPADLIDVRRRLLALRGIGPWTAAYIALRALGDPDIFMPTDLGVRHGLARMGLADATGDVIEAWSPWRSYALMHVWKTLDREIS